MEEIITPYTVREEVAELRALVTLLRQEVLSLRQDVNDLGIEVVDDDEVDYD